MIVAVNPFCAPQREVSVQALISAGYMVAAAAYLVLAAGALLSPVPPEPGGALRGLALLLLCSALVVMARIRRWAVSRLGLVWLTLAVIAAVQQAGGSRGFLFPAYFLLLLWAALPRNGAMASELGLAVGVAEAVAAVAGSSPAGPQEVLAALPAALWGLLPPALFGLAADALVSSSRRRSTLVTPEPAEIQRQKPAFPVAAARSLLPLVKRALVMLVQPITSSCPVELPRQYR